MNTQMEKEQELKKKNEQAEKLAWDLMQLARDTITVRFRFFDAALARLKAVSKPGLGGMATDGSKLYYDPAFLLRAYLDEPGFTVRAYLHMLLHCIFFHQFQYDNLDEARWNLAADIAVENIILEMDLPAARLTRDAEERDQLFRLAKRVPKLTAEKLYREFLVNEPSKEAWKEYERFFTVDNHGGWKHEEKDEIVITEEQWKKITKRIQTDLKTFSKNKSGSESLEKNVDEAVRERYNYRELLEKFMVCQEELTVNDDEFDYIYYTYGLNAYGNMPLVEPLEYREINKVKEFVIAIDTSASCRGELVKNFVSRTYEILKENENFFSHINVHVIQCDSDIQSDVKIENERDFRKFIAEGEIKGFGSTDFRPVFEYVEQMRQQGEFENLKGLIYFTDGYGVYPERMPAYDVIFAFLYEDENRMPVPPWAISVVLEDEEYEY